MRNDHQAADEHAPPEAEPAMRAELERLRAANADLQARVAASEGWFGELIENMADGLLVFDGLGTGDFRISYANRQAGEIFGTPADQLVGLDFLTLVHLEDRARIAARKRSVSLGVPTGAETYRALRSDGADIWLTSRSGAMSYGPTSKQQARIITLMRDVTAEHVRDAALADARSRIDHILQIVPGVFYQIAVRPNRAVTVSFISESVVDMFGVTPEVAAEPGFLLKRAQIDLASARWAALEKAGDDGIASLTYPIRHNGQLRWLRDTLRWRQQPNGGRDIVGFVTDASAEHQSEIEMRRMNWAQAAYSRSLTVILRSGPLDELMMRICESIVEEQPYVLACFVIPDTGPGLPVRFAACAGPAIGYVEGVDVSWSDDEPNGHGPTGCAMREGVPHVVHDTWTDPSYANWLERGNRFGIRSSVTVPCWCEGKVVGAILVYASEPNVFDTTEMALFQRLSDEIAFAIGLERDRVRLNEAHAARRQAEENLSAAVKLGPGLLYRARVQPTRVDIKAVFGDPYCIAHVTADDHDGSATLAQIVGQPESITAILAMEDDSTHSDDCAVTATDGSRRWLRNAVRIAERDEEAVTIVGYVAEVTQEKEQQLHRQQVTTLLTLGEMATGMAHELNQPLFSIILAAENATIRLERQPQAVTEIAVKLKKIITEAQRASKLIDHMRVFARNEPDQKQPVSWHMTLVSALEILQGKVRGIEVVNTLPTDLPCVLGWPIPLEQILINLIGNAVDAYEHAGQAETLVNGYFAPRMVTVSGAVQGDHVALRVQDQAGGIPPDALARIFEPFFTTKPVGKGTGLGLAIAADAVRAMGGMISAFNDDAGAVFEVRLPIAQ